MPTPYARLTNAQLTSLASTTLSALHPHDIRAVQEFLDRANWGKAAGPVLASNTGEGSDSDVSGQPTIAQILTMLNGQDV